MPRFCNIDNLRNFAYLVIIPITVNSYGFLHNCMTWNQTSDSMMPLTWSFQHRVGAWCLSLVGLTVAKLEIFLTFHHRMLIRFLWYSVLKHRITKENLCMLNNFCNLTTTEGESLASKIHLSPPGDFSCYLQWFCCCWVIIRCCSHFVLVYCHDFVIWWIVLFVVLHSFRCTVRSNCFTLTAFSSEIKSVIQFLPAD